MKTTNKNTLTNESQPTTVAKRRKLTTLSLIAGLALVALMPFTASAQVTITSVTELSGAGYQPQVAVDGQNVVEVHMLNPGGAVTWIRSASQ